MSVLLVQNIPALSMSPPAGLRGLQTFIDSGVIRKRGAGRSVVYVKVN